MEQKTKSLLKSRKVIYSISTLVVALVVIILPKLNVGWTPEQIEMLEKLLIHELDHCLTKFRAF